MEQLPPRSPDNEPHGHEGERLWPGEIDLTGVVRQDDALGDVIGDAIAEADTDGQLPDWGARTMARALANERDDPLDGALHRFAITGRAEPEALAQELVDLHERSEDPTVREWANWLGTYVIGLPEATEPAAAVIAPDEIHEPEDRDLGTSADNLFARLRHAFAEAEARGEPISGTDARTVATVLSIFLNADSEMARFADTGDANPVLLSQECQTVKSLTEVATGIDNWVEHLEQYLASRSDLGRQRSPREFSRPDEPVDPTPTGQTGTARERAGFVTPLEQVTAYLRVAFAEADARGEPIAGQDAQAVAAILAALLTPMGTRDSAMSRLAQTGAVEVDTLRAELQQIKAVKWKTPDIPSWVEYLEQYLEAGTGTSEPATPVERGISSHGDAFRAYLQLPDVDAADESVIQGFHDAYLGSAESIPQLLVIIRDEMAEAAQAEGLDLAVISDASLERAARMAYRIVEIDGKLHLFSK